MPKSRVFKSGSVGDLSFNVVPLIDVIFVLILFLILTTQISSAQFADLILPNPLQSQILMSPKDMDKPNRVIINVLSKSSLREKDENPAESGKAKGYEINGNPIEAGDAEKLGREISKQQAEAKAKGYKDFFVEIRGDRRVSYAYIQPILFAAAKAGVEKVNITALGEEGH